MTSPCTSGRWSAGRLLSRGHRLVRGWVSDFRSSSTAYAHHAGLRSPRPWRVWGARRGPGIPSVTTATEEGPVVCSEAPLARPPVCPSGGGVWWVPGASATRPSHRRFHLRMRHWCAVFADDLFPCQRDFPPVLGALRKFAVASRLCSVGLVVEGRVCPCLNDHAHCLGRGLSRRYDLADYALGVYITVTIFGHIVTFVGCLFFDYVPQGRCSHFQHRNCQWARVQFTFNLRVRGDSHACGEGSAL